MSVDQLEYGDFEPSAAMRDDFVEVLKGRRAISSGEPSLDGSMDEERSALSDSEIVHIARSDTIAKQAKGPSSDALEGDCLAEHFSRARKKEEEEWEDVLGSGDLMKRVLSHGRGDIPRDEYLVRINVIDTLHGVDNHEELQFILGYSCVIDAWELVVKLMRVGEVCQVKSASRFAYGEIGLQPTIKCDQPQEYTIELLSCFEMKFGEMSEEEMIELLVKLKERGNFYFSRKEYEKAIFVYKRGVGVWKKRKEGGEVIEGKGVCTILSAVHSNLAVSFAKLDDWKGCLNESEESLGLHPHNAKALFRKGQALIQLGECVEAITVLTQARNIDANDGSVERELEVARRKVKELKEKERAVYRKMVNGLSNEEKGLNDYKGLTTTLRMILVTFFIAMFALFIHFLVQIKTNS